MTIDEFNEKYKDYLEEGHYGLAIDNEKVIEYLDYIFPSLIMYLRDFKYSQIKMKFGSARFYFDCEIGDVIDYRLYTIITDGIESNINGIIKMGISQ